jgi:TonB family protein
VPLEPLKEAEANKAALSDETDPFQRRENPEAETKPAEPAVVAPPPPPAPKLVLKVEKKGPLRVTEEVTPPVPNSTNAKPEYPPEAKSKGIEGVVLVKYIVSETGMVTDAQILKGPPELGSVCIAAVKRWRFQPAVLDGQAVAVVRVARFPFRIKT